MAYRPQARNKPSNRAYDPKAVEKMAQVMPQAQIARVVGVHRTTIMRYLKSVDIAPKLEDLQSELAGDLLLSARKQLDLKHRTVAYFSNMDEEGYATLPDEIKLKIWTTANIGAGIDFDKYRIQAGLAGLITEHRQAYDIEISMVDSEIKRLESRFSGTKQNNGVIDAEYEDTKNTMSCKGTK